MRLTPSSLPIVLVIVMGLSTNRILAECAAFYCALEDVCDGTPVQDPPTFVPGVNGNCASFTGDGYIRFSDEMFGVPNGSVSHWFKRTPLSASGGIRQIGAFGEPNSLGLFYSTDADGPSLYFELVSSSGQGCQVKATNVLPGDEFVHIVASWHLRGESFYYLKLFINGEYVDYAECCEPMSHDQARLDVGTAGVAPWYGNAEGCLDELRFFDWDVLDAEVYAEYVWSSNKHRRQVSAKPASVGPVQLIDEQLIVNGEPFLIRGVGYQPLPIGYCNTTQNVEYIYTDTEILDQDVTLLRALNANTVRIWADLPDGSPLLDKLYNNGEAPIYAILAIEVPSATDDPSIDYCDPTTITEYEQKIQGFVTKWKDHDAVLAWAIGNENNYGYGGDLCCWYNLANRMAQAAYETEVPDGSADPSYHPVMLVNGQMMYFGNIDKCSDDLSLSFIDMWGHNAYGGYDYHCYFDYYDRISARPLVITEFGVDAYDSFAPCGEPATCGENEQVQADWVERQWNQIRMNCLGGTVMEYADEWWWARCQRCDDEPCCDGVWMAHCESCNEDPSNCCGSHETGGAYADTQPDKYTSEEWWGILRRVDNGESPDILEPRAAYFRLQELWTRELGIPAVSSWGLLTAAGLMLVAGTVILRRRSACAK